MGRKHARMTKGILQQIRSAVFFSPPPPVMNAKCIIKATDANAHIYICIRVFTLYSKFSLEIRVQIIDYVCLQMQGVILVAHSCIKQRRKQINKIALNNSPNAIYYVCVFNQRRKLSISSRRDVFY